MSLASASLPTDLDELRLFAAGLQAELARKEIEIAANAAEIHAKTLHIEKLKMQLSVLRRARFGRSSEKLDRDIEQLELLIDELEEEAADVEAKQAACRAALPKKPAEPGRHPTRKPLPAHLPREILTHQPACTCPGCGGKVFSQIGQDEREVLEYVPSSFKVIVHVRPKLSCRGCETILQMPMPSLPIERGRPGAGLIAHVMVSKFCDHTPLHRQSGIYAREGVELDRATLTDWVGKAAFKVMPLADAIGRHVRAGAVLHADDTTVPVLAPGTGKTKTGRLWVALRDERPWGSAVPPAAVYLYSADRRGIHAEALLGKCRGFLHADAYAGFEKLYRPMVPGAAPPLLEVACWSHARRKFYDEHHETGSPIALEILERIAALFAVESSISGRSPDARVAIRYEHAGPRLAQLKAYLETSLARISGKSDLAAAIRYSLSRWTALTRYLNDGRLEISNNAAERAMKPLVLGRKNYLFCGSDAGGQRAACFYTIIETAKLNGINPEAYLTDIIRRIDDHPALEIDSLLPWRWQP